MVATSNMAVPDMKFMCCFATKHHIVSVVIFDQPLCENAAENILDSQPGIHLEARRAFMHLISTE